MKKFFKATLIPLALFMTACQPSAPKEGITKITYETVDFMGGRTRTFVLDFVHNEYQKRDYIPGDETSNRLLFVVKTFTEEEEKTFINGIANCGLLSIKSEYKRTNVLDGGGWSFLVEYKDGKSFSSKGENNGPYKVFDKCSTYYYDLCGEQVMGMLPSGYGSSNNTNQ